MTTSLHVLNKMLAMYCSLLVVRDLEGIYGMRAGWSVYSTGEDIWFSNYCLCKSIYHL